MPYSGGKIYINGQEQHHINPRKLLEAGVSHIPQDRHRTGLVLEFTISENLILQEFYTSTYSKNGVLKQDVIRSHGEKMIKDYQIKATDPSVTARTLSGGNQQKIILARELNRKPKILIAVQPTRGLDIGATEFVRRQLIEQRDNGSAVLLISTELEEILSIADRIAVIHEGEFMGIIPNENVDIEEIGLMMAGRKKAS
jgi:simple sugar transport system ATP-binding protein